MPNEEKQRLTARIDELNERVEQLRLSRRVLMNLLEKLDHEHRHYENKMLAEQKKLKKANVKYAFNIMKNNARLLEFEKKLQT